MQRNTRTSRKGIVQNPVPAPTSLPYYSNRRQHDQIQQNAQVVQRDSSHLQSQEVRSLSEDNIQYNAVSFREENQNKNYKNIEENQNKNYENIEENQNKNDGLFYDENVSYMSCLSDHQNDYGECIVIGGKTLYTQAPLNVGNWEDCINLSEYNLIQSLNLANDAERHDAYQQLRECYRDEPEVVVKALKSQGAPRKYIQDKIIRVIYEKYVTSEDGMSTPNHLRTNHLPDLPPATIEMQQGMNRRKDPNSAYYYEEYPQNYFQDNPDQYYTQFPNNDANYFNQNAYNRYEPDSPWEPINKYMRYIPNQTNLGSTVPQEPMNNYTNFQNNRQSSSYPTGRGTYGQRSQTYRQNNGFQEYQAHGMPNFQDVPRHVSRDTRYSYDVNTSPSTIYQPKFPAPASITEEDIKARQYAKLQMEHLKTNMPRLKSVDPDKVDIFLTRLKSYDNDFKSYYNRSNPLHTHLTADVADHIATSLRAKGRTLQDDDAIKEELENIRSSNKLAKSMRANQEIDSVQWNSKLQGAVMPMKELIEKFDKIFFGVDLEEHIEETLCKTIFLDKVPRKITGDRLAKAEWKKKQLTTWPSLRQRLLHLSAEVESPLQSEHLYSPNQNSSKSSGVNNKSELSDNNGTNNTNSNKRGFKSNNKSNSNNISNGNYPKKNLDHIICRLCDQKGHYMRDCTHPDKQKLMQQYEQKMQGKARQWDRKKNFKRYDRSATAKHVFIRTNNEGNKVALMMDDCTDAEMNDYFELRSALGMRAMLEFNIDEYNEFDVDDDDNDQFEDFESLAIAAKSNRCNSELGIVKCSRASTVEAVVMLKANNSNSWYNVSACLDSGASISLIGRNEYKKYGYNTHLTDDIFFKFVTTADGNRTKLLGYTFLEIRIRTGDLERPIHLTEQAVYIVDSDTWTELLIGADVLKPLELTPEQNIKKHEGKKYRIKQVIPRNVPATVEELANQAKLELLEEPKTAECKRVIDNPFINLNTNFSFQAAKTHKNEDNTTIPLEYMFDIPEDPIIRTARVVGFYNKKIGNHHNKSRHLRPKANRFRLVLDATVSKPPKNIEYQQHQLEYEKYISNCFKVQEGMQLDCVDFDMIKKSNKLNDDIEEIVRQSINLEKLVANTAESDWLEDKYEQVCQELEKFSLSFKNQMISNIAVESSSRQMESVDQIDQRVPKHEDILKTFETLHGNTLALVDHVKLNNEEKICETKEDMPKLVSNIDLPYLSQSTDQNNQQVSNIKSLTNLPKNFHGHISLHEDDFRKRNEEKSYKTHEDTTKHHCNLISQTDDVGSVNQSNRRALQSQNNVKPYQNQHDDVLLSVEQVRMPNNDNKCNSIEDTAKTPICIYSPSQDEFLEHENGYGDNVEVDNQLREQKIKDNRLEMRKIVSEQLQKVFNLALLTNDQHCDLETLYQDHIDCFGTDQSLCQMSELPPLEVTIKAGVTPHRASARQQGPIQQRALKKKLQDLLAIGMIRPVDNPLWGCAAFMVPKKDGRWRYVIDLRPLNDRVEVNALDLPNIETQLAMLPLGARYFVSLDMLAGFDMLKVHKQSQIYFGVSTIYGNFIMLGSPMGYLNTPSIYQNRILRYILGGVGNDSFFGREHAGVLQWLDDLLVYADSWKGLMDVLKGIFKNLKKYKVRLNLKKCDLFSKSANWCGRIVTSSGWNYSLSHYDKILGLRQPKTLGELETILYIVNWLHLAIPKAVEVKDIFQELAADIKKKLQDSNGGKLINRKKRSNIDITQVWNNKLEEAYRNLLEIIRVCSTRNLSRYSLDHPLYLYTDASDVFYSMVIVQSVKDFQEKLLENPNYILDKNIIKDKTDGTVIDSLADPTKDSFVPIAFLSGKFVNSQTKWPIIQKEIYPIIKAFKRFDYLLQNHLPGIIIRTDHRNILFVLQPSKATSKNALGRIYRWALLLQSCNITVQHIPGVENVLADLLSRWDYVHFYVPNDIARFAKCNFHTVEIMCRNIHQMSTETKRKRRRLHRTHFTKRKKVSVEQQQFREEYRKYVYDRVSFLNPNYMGKWKQLTTAELVNAQEEQIGNRKDILWNMEQKLFVKKGKVWIPNSILNRFLIHYHVASGHVSPSTEYENLVAEYYIEEKDLRRIVFEYHAKCLHCNQTPSLIRRPMHQYVKAHVPNLAIHADYLKVHKGYLLCIMDEFTRKVELIYSNQPTTDKMIEGLLLWRARYGLLDSFTVYTDQGSHFCNILMKTLQKYIAMSQRFSIAYSPWTNGSIESINHKILQIFRSLLSQYHLQFDDWPLLLPLVMHFINNRKNPKRFNLSPNNLMLGTRNYLENLFLVQREERCNEMVIFKENILVEPVSAENVANYIEQLQNELRQNQEKVFHKLQKIREERIRNVNDKLAIDGVQFGLGDYVLLSWKKTPFLKSKVQLIWDGPYQVIDTIADNVYQCMSPVGGETIAHAVRMRFYEGKSFKITEEIRLVFLQNRQNYHVEDLLELVITNDGKEMILVKWLGFTDEYNTMEPLQTLVQDVPVYVEKLLKKLSEAGDIQATRMLNKYFARAQMISIGNSNNHKYRVLEIYGNEAQLLVNRYVQYGRYSATGWNNIERKILQQCIWRFGIGDYSSIHAGNYLCGKNTQQIYTQLQRLLGKQAINEYHGMRLTLEDVRKYNFKKYQTKYHKETMQIAKHDLLKKKFLARLHFKTCKNEQQIIDFYRRRDNLYSRISYYNHISANGIKNGTQTIDGLDLEIVKSLKEVLLEELIFYWKFMHRKVRESLMVNKFRDAVPISNQMFQYQQDKFRLVLYKDNYWKCYQNGESIGKIYIQPKDAIVICNDVRNINWLRFRDAIEQYRKKPLEVIVADPPWMLSSNNPTRGPALQYSQLRLEVIKNIPWKDLQPNHGFLFLWVINSTLDVGIEIMKDNGYKVVEYLVWVKTTSGSKLAVSIGRHLNHAKEICIIGRRGTLGKHATNFGNDVLFCKRLEQSRKPEEVYTIIERSFPNSSYLEVFGRLHNVRNNWVTLGNDKQFGYQPSIIKLPQFAQFWKKLKSTDAKTNRDETDDSNHKILWKEILSRVRQETFESVQSLVLLVAQNRFDD